MAIERIETVIEEDKIEWLKISVAWLKNAIAHYAYGSSAKAKSKRADYRAGLKFSRTPTYAKDTGSPPYSKF